MARYPKPEGWNGGPDGKILRTGSAGHLGPQTNDEEDQGPWLDRRNEKTFDEADFGGLHYGDA